MVESRMVAPHLNLLRRSIESKGMNPSLAVYFSSPAKDCLWWNYYRKKRVLFFVIGMGLFCEIAACDGASSSAADFINEVVQPPVVEEAPPPPPPWLVYW